MVTPHTIVFPEDSGQTLITKVVKRDDDSIYYTADTVTERTNAKGIYEAAFSNLPANDYTLHNFVGALLSSTGLVMGVVDATEVVYEQSLVLGGGGIIVLSAAASQSIASLAAGVLEVKRGDTYRYQLTGLGDISDRQKLWFTVKNNQTDADADAILQITEADGAIRFNGGVPASSTLASITVVDQVAGTANLFIDKSLTAAMGTGTGLGLTVQPRSLTAAPWDIQVERNNSTADVNTVSEGSMNVSLDVTRAIS